MQYLSRQIWKKNEKSKKYLDSKGICDARADDKLMYLFKA